MHPPVPPAAAAGAGQVGTAPDLEGQLDPDQWVALLAAQESRRPSRFERAMSGRGAKVLFVVGVVAAVLVVAAVAMALLARVAG